jgi:hypothetical protein
MNSISDLLREMLRADLCIAPLCGWNGYSIHVDLRKQGEKFMVGFGTSALRAT